MADNGTESLIFEPRERRARVLDVIRGARRKLALAIFRCDDFAVLDAIADALRRGVEVDLLLTPRAKGWKKRLGELWDYLESMGARMHRYEDPVVKYHAKYLVADDGPALVASLNFTHKCFETTIDFIVITHDPDVVRGVWTLFECDCQSARPSFPPDVTGRLIVGPEEARPHLISLLRGATTSIRIMDHKLTDPGVLDELRILKSQGIAVDVLRDPNIKGLQPHGKLIIVDERLAVIGSMALSALSLGFRREVAIVVNEPRLVRQLNRLFLAARRPGPSASATEGH